MKKITASELRIGNYIQYITGIDSIVFNTVKEIHGDKVAISLKEYYDDDGEMCCGQGFMGIDGIEPIPLTEEWLLKFGWAKEEVYANTYVDNTSFRQAVLSYDINNKVFGIESDYDFIEIDHIKYVHSFQNLIFALTGNELTLK